MKFIHIADMHFDSPFTMLSDKGNLGKIRRLEQRQAFEKMIKHIKENKIPYLFIAGDLYEQEYIRKETITYINDLFKQIPDTKIFISPGNHDPYLKNSYYSQFKWNDNVKIFNSKIEKVELEEADIYGYGFDDFYCLDFDLEGLEIENRNKLNILLIHGNIDASLTEEKQYNSMSKKLLKEKGFDYIALGHIHKTNYEENANIIYPGSMISFGFDELGIHGMLEVDLTKENLNKKMIPIDPKEFKEIELECTNILTLEELIEKINCLKLEDKKLYKITLVGRRNFEISLSQIYEYSLDEKILKIKDKTKLNYDLEKIKNNTTLRGIFAQEMLEKINQAETEEEREKIEKAIEIGMEVLE